MIAASRYKLRKQPFLKTGLKIADSLTIPQRPWVVLDAVAADYPVPIFPGRFGPLDVNGIEPATFTSNVLWRAAWNWKKKKIRSDPGIEGGNKNKTKRVRLAVG